MNSKITCYSFYAAGFSSIFYHVLCQDDDTSLLLTNFTDDFPFTDDFDSNSTRTKKPRILKESSFTIGIIILMLVVFVLSVAVIFTTVKYISKKRKDKEEKAKETAQLFRLVEPKSPDASRSHSQSTNAMKSPTSPVASVKLSKCRVKSVAVKLPSKDNAKSKSATTSKRSKSKT